jgi:hypothetical protein
LGRTELRQITELLLDQTKRRLHAQDITLEVTEAAVDWLANRGYQPEFGARPLRRTIQRELDNRVSRMLLDGKLLSGQQLRVDVHGGELIFAVSGSAKETCTHTFCSMGAQATFLPPSSSISRTSLCPRWQHLAMRPMSMAGPIYSMPSTPPSVNCLRPRCPRNAS